MPVVHKNNLSAILYIENNLITDCFKSKQISVLSILTLQVAISLENSRFFQDQFRAMEELAHVQKKIAQNENMHRREHEEFIDRICHEIRNPIQGLVGNCDLIMVTLRDLELLAQNEQTKSLLESIRLCTLAIQICAQHQKAITDDVLTLSKLELQQVKLNAKPFSIRKLVIGVLSTFTEEITNKNVEYAWKIHNLQDVILVGDTSRISQVLMNLISNATKFTERGSITVTADTQQENEKMRVNVMVQDTGCGMTEKETEIIFNRFAQAQRTFAEYGSCGLGLFICKNLVELMGGTMQVTSAKSESTSFTFSILCDIATREQAEQYNSRIV
jgi:signal transduction histidine kinase